MSLNLASIAYMRKYVDKAVATGGIQLGGGYDETKYYKANTIVSSGGKTYIAVQDVPAGVTLEDENYWKVFVESSGDKTYDYTQSTASNNWIITHNLNKYPSVSITDDNGNTILGDIIYKNLNTLEITFSEEITGKVHLN